MKRPPENMLDPVPGSFNAKADATALGGVWPGTRSALTQRTE
jgi:hypothetical protein